MTKNSVKNMSASVRQRLLNKSKADGRPFQEIVQYYAMERFLYRLSQSIHSKRFILKGALMLRIWQAPEMRPTMDIDMLGKTSNEIKDLISQITDVLSVEVPADGLSFFVENITAEHITEDADYKGIRIQFPVKLDTMRLNIQMDIGFGDIVYPGPEESELPTILDFPPPKLLCYSRESTIAEKFEAMLKRRELNSRMKDFYDIWMLSRQFDFDGKNLAEAITRTLEQRGTGLPEDIIAFSGEFIALKQIQWNAFRKKLNQDQIPENFEDIILQLKKFITPVASAIYTKEHFSFQWSAPGPWK